MIDAKVHSGRQARVPALEPRTLYTSRLSARSALYSELRLLLEGLTEPLSAVAYRRLVVEENRLSRSATATRRKVWKELHSRYRLDQSDSLFAAFWEEWQRAESDRERDLTAYVLFALNDRLVADLCTEWLFGLLRRAPVDLHVHDVRAFLERAAQRHPEVAGWSEETTAAVAQKFCTSIRDFGLARGTMRKVTVRPALYGAPVRLLVRALRMVSTPPLALIQSPIFRLLGIDAPEVIDALSSLNRTGALRFRIQGDVVELDLREAA